MGFLDKVKQQAEQATTKAKEGVAEVQTKRELSQAYNELGQKAHESGLAELLPSLRETVWVGLSAGSMVMTPRIGEDFVGWKPPIGDDSTLGIVNSLDYGSIFWTVDTLGWQGVTNQGNPTGQSVSTVVSRSLNAATPGEIVLNAGRSGDHGRSMNAAHRDPVHAERLKVRDYSAEHFNETFGSTCNGEFLHLQDPIDERCLIDVA